MSTSLDMSLDDIIKKNKNSSAAAPRRGRGRRASGLGPTRRLPKISAARPAPYLPTPKAPETTWQHDMFVDQAGMIMGRASAIETGTKLYISNLDYGVSNEDIKELFSEVGDLKRYSIHYDRSGRSKGTAEVVFSRRADALAAVKRYNNVQLDGKPMKIEIVGTNIATPALPAAPVAPIVPFGSINGPTQGVLGRSGAVGRPRGGASGGRGFGRGRGRGRVGRREKISAEDLDADLEKYHAEAMETN